MKAVFRYGVFLILPVTLVILWLAGVFHPKISAGEVKPERKVVEGIRTERVMVHSESLLSFTGTTVPSDRAEVSTRTMGFVGEVAVKEGDFVKKGQLLIRIDPRDTRARIEAARRQVLQAQKRLEAALARYRAAEKTYNRYRELLKEGAVTPQEFDTVEAQFRSAQAELEAVRAGVEMAKQNLRAVSAGLSYAEIRAPFDGYVVRKNVDVGDMAAPGAVLLVLEKPPYRVEFELPERFYGKVKPGDRVAVRIESLRRETTAEVVEVEPSVDPSARTFRVKALLKDRSVRGGFFARVYLKEEDRILLIPRKAVYRKWDLTAVWVVEEDGVLRLRFVRLGREMGDRVEVLSGLSEGERVVVEGLEKACDGCLVGG